MADVDISVYVHIPFCQVRCAYCDFNTYAGMEQLIPDYLQALEAELRGVADAAARRGAEPLEVRSVFLGGGTPSLLSIPQLGVLFATLRECFRFKEACEITLEANPGTVDAEKLAALHLLGINRISFGVQSAQENELRMLDRLHDFPQAVQAVTWARQAGFTNLNLDLIYGLMRQSLESWRDTLHKALALDPDHLSLYALTLERGTPMFSRVQRGELTEPDPDLAADMYEWACTELDREGFAHYEISNWARRDPRDDGITFRLACYHNQQTWRNQPYLGFGAGAHGSVPGWRYANVRLPRAYIARLREGGPFEFPFSPAVVKRWRIDRSTEMRETMMLGLRLLQEGVENAGFASRYGDSPRQAFRTTLDELAALGLIELGSERVRLTPRGYLLGNRVFERFV